MKFYMIHLMPFADLDLSYDKHYNSAWVTLPNTYYDPQKGAKLYNRYHRRTRARRRARLRRRLLSTSTIRTPTA